MTADQINIAFIIIGVVVLLPGTYKLLRAIIRYYRFKYIMWSLGRAIHKRRKGSKNP